MGEEKEKLITVREYDEKKDVKAVEEMERRCDVGSAAATTSKGSGKKNEMKKKKEKEKSTSLFVDLLGDPICRIRHYPDHVMLVAEYGEKKEMVGVIRACIKTVTRGRKPMNGFPIYVKVAYILGLRVSSTHRRLGIGTKLVAKVEEWCRHKGAEYAYMATDRSNSASINLFTEKFSYARFRSPAILVHPVHAHRLPTNHRSATVLRLPPALAEPLYRRLFASSEFFPKDIGAVLANRLSLGTFMALPASGRGCVAGWDPHSGECLPPSFALMSLWNTKEVFRLQVAGAPAATRTAVRWIRAVDKCVPWMGVPSLGDLFRPFGVYFMYGLHMEGKGGEGLMRCLCRVAHNIAMEDEGCAAVVTEVGREDPVRAVVPHWRRFSCDEDVWCMKRLAVGGGGGGGGDGDNWVRSQPLTEVMFVDPREF